MRLAGEYDAAQERGEVAKLGTNQTQVGVTGGNTLPTAADIGLTRKEIHEARQIRDAEKAEPGVTARVVGEIVSRGEEPTKANRLFNDRVAGDEDQGFALGEVKAGVLLPIRCGVVATKFGCYFAEVIQHDLDVSDHMVVKLPR